MSFVDPEIGANVVFGGKLGAQESSSASKETSAQWESMVERMVEDASPYGAAGHYYIQDVIDPRETRGFLVRALKICQDSRGKGLGEHRLANWPTKF